MEKKKLTKEEQMVKDAWEFINCQVNAIKQRDKKFTSLADIGCYNHDKKVHLHGLLKLSALTNIPYSRIEWDGNDVCNSQYDEVFFIYKGVRFFELADKIMETKEDEIDERQ